MEGRRATLWATLAVGLTLALAPAAWAVPESFEGSTSWTFSGLWHVQANPQNVSVASPGINPNLVTLPDSGALLPAFNGSNVAWFGDAFSPGAIPIPDGTFCGTDWNTSGNNTGASKNGCTSSSAFQGDLTSPAFDFTNATSAQLTFRAWYEVEAVDPQGHDQINVQWSTDNFVSDINDLGTINPIDANSGGPDESYSNMGREQSPAWKRYVVDLTPAAGLRGVQVRFQFLSGDVLFQGFRGAAIDSVDVTNPFTSGTPQISSATACSDTGFGVLNGSNFVVGSQVLVDGNPVTAGITADNRIEYYAPPAAHTVSVVSPNKATSNSFSVTPVTCLPQPQPQPQDTGTQQTTNTIFGPTDQLPPPILGHTANAFPESGTVLVKLPAGAASAKYAWAHASATGFIPLSQARTIPMGSILDTTRGQVKLSMAGALAGSLQDGHFKGGLFNIKQGTTNPLATMSLMGGGLNKCGTKVPKGGAAKLIAARKRGRSLFSSVKGRFRTRGRNSSATVRGTQWLQKDTCAGTLTVVKQGTVVVQDFAKKRKVTLKKGKRYLARPPRKLHG